MSGPVRSTIWTARTAREANCFRAQPAEPAASANRSGAAAGLGGGRRLPVNLARHHQRRRHREHAAGRRITNAATNAPSLGLELPAITLPVSTAVATAAPNAPPTVRVTVLIPVAIPTSCCGTAATIRLAIDAIANEIPAPSSALDTMKCHGCPCSSASHRNAADARPAPPASVARKPTTTPSRPARDRRAAGPPRPG